MMNFLTPLVTEPVPPPFTDKVFAKTLNPETAVAGKLKAFYVDHKLGTRKRLKLQERVWFRFSIRSYLTRRDSGPQSKRD